MSKNKYYYLVVTDKGTIHVGSSQLPIFWNHRVARLYAKTCKGRVIPIPSGLIDDWLN